tara:strand:+ start:129 stop:455 length:327 start_codon:yes stop_codon:yes gene_type:complete
MANWDDNSGEDNKNGLTEIEQMQLDAVMLDTAYNNSYLVLTNQISFEDLLTERFTKGGEAVMAFDPTEGPLQEELENMISYYIQEEAYEKCAKLQKLINKIYPQTINE